jgi:hypothetical protein
MAGRDRQVRRECRGNMPAVGWLADSTQFRPRISAIRSASVRGAHFSPRGWQLANSTTLGRICSLTCYMSPTRVIRLSGPKVWRWDQSLNPNWTGRVSHVATAGTPSVCSRRLDWLPFTGLQVWHLQRAPSPSPKCRRSPHPKVRPPLVGMFLGVAPWRVFIVNCIICDLVDS